MKELIACLGYDLLPDGSIHEILKSRLNETIRLLRANPRSTCLLMGAVSYRDNPGAKSQASAMRVYIASAASDVAASRIKIEEASTSSVEQIYNLKSLAKSYDLLSIVASEYFVDRVRLYVKYLLPEVRVNFVAAKLPASAKAIFVVAEKEKLRTAKVWLRKHRAGKDRERILTEQKAFQESVKSGAKSHPDSWVEVEYLKP